MESKSNNSSPKKTASSTRLNKYIANSGICSRREADMYIAMGMVKINGKIVVEMGYQVQPGDDVRYDGRRVVSDKPAYVLLNKPKGLTNSEWKIVKKHSEIGYRILSSLNEFSEIADYVLEHHEKWDGSGYPGGLKGEQIPESARIVALADVFDALTMVRPYKEAWSVEDATKYLLKESGSHFDPRLVQLFEDNIDSFYRIKEEWLSK